MRRRELIIGFGAAFGSALSVRAQPKELRAIGYLGSTSPGPVAPFLAAFRRGLMEKGWIEGQNVSIEYRWAENHFDRLPKLAVDLASRKVDLIVTAGGPASAIAAKHATSTIPILFSAVGDPIAAGLVTNLAKPGGNVTGFSVLVVVLNPKRLELLSELVPEARVIAVLVNPNSVSSDRIVLDLQEASRAKGIQLVFLKAGTAAEIDAAFGSLAQGHAQALLVGSDAVFNNLRAQMVALASHYAIPAFYEWREFPDIGGLASYGPSQTGINHEAGLYAGRILNGEKPGDLPVQQPTKFELVINLKTANSLGLTIPLSILTRADEVIE